MGPSKNSDLSRSMHHSHQKQPVISSVFLVAWSWPSRTNLCFMKFILWSTNGSWNEFSRLQSGFFFEKEKYSDTVIKRNTVFLDVSSELEGANMKIFYLYLPVLAETTITKYHTLDCLNSRNVFFHCSGDQSLRQISW